MNDNENGNKDGIRDESDIDEVLKIFKKSHSNGIPGNAYDNNATININAIHPDTKFTSFSRGIIKEDYTSKNNKAVQPRNEVEHNKSTPSEHPQNAQVSSEHIGTSHTLPHTESGHTNGVHTAPHIPSEHMPEEHINTVFPVHGDSSYSVSPDATRINLEPVKKPSAHLTSETIHMSEPKPENIGHISKPHTEKQITPSTTVSLDDFNTASESTGGQTKGRRLPTRNAKGEKGLTVSFLGSTKFGVIKLVAYILFVTVSVWIISANVIDIGNDVFAFVKDGTSEILEQNNTVIDIPEGADTRDIAEILKKAGIIKHPVVFEKYAKFRISKRSYLTGKYLSGKQTVNPLMSFDKLLDTLSDYERTVNGTVRITIPEGLTVKETIDLLVKNGVGKTEDYIDALQNYDYDFRFVKSLTKDTISKYRFDTNYSYRLEGYLFPDTYDFYLNENPVSVLNKFLENFNKKFEEGFYERTNALGMTVDDVITLASLIEKEGGSSNDYYYISSVFHNRLKNSATFPFLNSDASLQYALHKRTDPYSLDTSADHPYNTYVYKGLPPGPICNPGIEAIYAALYPENTSFYYFYTKKNGETVYSRTLDEHQSYINADKSK